MKSATAYLVILLSVLVLSGCMANATNEEISQMCENLVGMRSKGTGINEASALAKLEKDFAGRKEQIQIEIKSEQRQWDDELQAKLEAIGADLTDKEKEEKAEELAEEKKKLEEEFQAQKDDIATKRAKDIENLGPAKQKAIEAVKAKAAKLKTKMTEEISKCVEEARTKGVSQKMAQCRINAQTTDEYWNICI